MSTNSLIIFVRRPELGKVKTRIAKSVGARQALVIYNELLKHTREVVTKCDVQRHLFYTDDIIRDDDWSNTKFIKHRQASGDLGDKMSAAFEVCLRQSHKVVIIGSDCATLQPAIIERAFAALDESDVVIGPTFDGGYYLLGLKEPREVLFKGIEWSTPVVFEQTIAAINHEGLSYTELPQLADIDHIEDWEKWGWKIQ